MLRGGANGKLKGNRHIALKREDQIPTANLLLSMAEMAGANVESLGKSTGKLSL